MSSARRAAVNRRVVTPRGAGVIVPAPAGADRQMTWVRLDGQSALELPAGFAADEIEES
jgi:hypothetical protein